MIAVCEWACGTYVDVSLAHMWKSHCGTNVALSSGRGILCSIVKTTKVIEKITYLLFFFFLPLIFGAYFLLHPMHFMFKDARHISNIHNTGCTLLLSLRALSLVGFTCQ